MFRIYSYLFAFLICAPNFSVLAEIVENQAIIEFVDKKLEEHQLLGQHTVRIQGRDFIIEPNVCSPLIFVDSFLFTGKIPVKEGENFLEIGCGAGIIGITAALDQKARVLGVDINPLAIDNTILNANLLGAIDRVEVRWSDVFSNIKLEEKFDVVFWAVPFTHVERENLSELEMAVYDPFYRSLTLFFEQANLHLTLNGRVFFGFSTKLGDEENLRLIASQYGWELDIFDVIYTANGIPFEIFEAVRR
jgi:methylase of polypeptide subunit release factors